MAKKRRLIDLLNEQKAILINRAVTKGLNPNAPMKASGVDWIGEIPAHWDVPPMYARFQIELGKMLDGAKITGRHLVRYLRNTDVQWGSISTTELPEMDIREGEFGRYTVRKGDLLVCEGGEIGRCAVVAHEPEEPLGFQKALHRLRAFNPKNESIEYTYFFFRAAGNASAFQLTAKTNTIAHLTGEMLSRYRFPKPPVDEQRSIAERLRSIESKFATVVSTQERSIFILNEFKQTLIANAVTGKIKI